MHGTQTPATGSTTWAGVKAALAAAAGDVATLAGSIVQQLSGLNATATAGVTLENTTTPDAGQPAQWPPLVLWKGGARVLGSNRVVQARITLEPTSGGNITFRVAYDLGAGAGFVDAFYFTTSSPGQFVAGLAATRFLALGSNGAFLLDANNSGLVLGPSAEVQLNGRVATQPFFIRSNTTSANTDSIAFWAFGETKTATERVFSFGHGTSSSSRDAVITGDGVLEAPELHIDGGASAPTVRAGDFTMVIDTVYLANLSGSNIVGTIPAAAATNFNRSILVHQVVAGTATITFTPPSGNVEGAGTFVVTGNASTPLRTWRLTSLGAASLGWKVQQI